MCIRKKTFEKLTGVKDYESNNGSIYINPADYSTLFGKGNYQATVYVKDLKELEGDEGCTANHGLYDSLAERRHGYLCG